VNCPYCGESITVLIDPGDAGDSYIEDCQVCCRPITFAISGGLDGEFVVTVHTEDDAI
jgi:hypothetical protein